MRGVSAGGLPSVPTRPAGGRVGPSVDELAAQRLLVCPRCAGSVSQADGAWRCEDPACPFADQAFPVVAGVPALVDFERSVLDADRLVASDGEPPVVRSALARRLRRLVSPDNAVAADQVGRMVSLLLAEATGRRPRILVIGGGTVGSGLEWLYARADVDLISFDIYASPVTQFVADAHSIPLAAGAVDGVVVQAVLEHVLEPVVVGAEINRVLRPGGIVYADTPFLQQVHEAAHDFTRFTESGHRYLFRGFDCLDSGTVAGAGTSLRWSIDYFVRALTRSKSAGRLCALAFFWLSHLDRALDPRHSLDAASSVFFLGRKSDRDMTGADILAYYQGGG